MGGYVVRWFSFMLLWICALPCYGFDNGGARLYIPADKELVFTYQSVQGFAGAKYRYVAQLQVPHPWANPGSTNLVEIFRIGDSFSDTMFASPTQKIYEQYQSIPASSGTYALILNCYYNASGSWSDMDDNVVGDGGPDYWIIESRTDEYYGNYGINVSVGTVPAGNPVTIPIPGGYKIDISSVVGASRRDALQEFRLSYGPPVIILNGGASCTISEQPAAYNLTITAYHRPNVSSDWTMSRGNYTLAGNVWHANFEDGFDSGFTDLVVTGTMTKVTTGEPVQTTIPPGMQVDITSAVGSHPSVSQHRYELTYPGTTVAQIPGNQHTIAPAQQAYGLTITAYHRANDSAQWTMSTGHFQAVSELIWRAEFDDGNDGDFTDLVVTGTMTRISIGASVTVVIPPNFRVDLSSAVGSHPSVAQHRYELAYQSATVPQIPGNQHTIAPSQEIYNLTITAYHRANDSAEWKMSTGRFRALSDLVWVAEFDDGNDGDFTDLVVTGIMTSFVGIPVQVVVPAGVRVDIDSRVGSSPNAAQHRYELAYFNVTVPQTPGSEMSIPPNEENRSYTLTITGYHRNNDSSSWIMSMGRPRQLSQYEWLAEFEDGFDSDYAGLAVKLTMVPISADALAHWANGNGGFDWYDTQTSPLISSLNYPGAYYGQPVPLSTFWTECDCYGINCGKKKKTESADWMPGGAGTGVGAGYNSEHIYLMHDKTASDPMHVNNLEFVYEANDFTIPGRGFEFAFTRTYRSRMTYNGPLGRNWDHAYNMRLVLHPSQKNMVILYNGESRGDLYYISEQGLTPPSFHHRKVLRETNGNFIMRYNDGTLVNFMALDNSAKAGKLNYMQSRCGSRLTFSYNAEGKLSQVLDTLSRSIDFFYNDRGKIIKIKDFTGREVTYEYNSLDQLISVRMPTILGTPNGNDFPNGKLCRYTYTSGFSDEEINHNLLTITFPNEAAVNGPPVIINYYNADDRLIMQEWGGTNSSGVVAGGSMVYARENLNVEVDPNNASLARERVTVLDRNNNETVLSYDNQKRLMRVEHKTRGVRPGDPTSFVTEYKYDPETGKLKELISPEGGRTVYEYVAGNDEFQRGNLLSVTQFPNSRGGDQQFIKTSYQYEPLYNKIWKITEARGNDPSYVPQNGGVASAERYTVENVPDYFEGGLDTQGCDCGHTLGELVAKFGINISSVMSQLNQGDLNGDGRFSLCGNTVLIRMPKVLLRSGSPQADAEGGLTQIIEIRKSFNKFGQISWVEDPEGVVTEYRYYPESDPDGNGRDVRSGVTNTGKPFDTTTGGLPLEVIADARHTPRYRRSTEPTQISVKMAYDALGNVTSITDGRGVRTDFVYNAINQPVEIRLAADVGAAGETGLVAYGYRKRMYYDHNNNLVKSETEYRDGNNPDLPQYLETTYVYDIMDHLLEKTVRIQNGQTVAMRWRYDKNGNVTEQFSPLAVAGVEPSNYARFVYDERDLLYQSIAAPGTPQEARMTYRYNADGQVVEVENSEDHNGDGRGDATTISYDGFGRLVKALDAAGNEITYSYDPASRPLGSKVFGPIAGPTRNTNSTASNVLLAESLSYYDELGRLFRSDSRLFVPQGVLLQRVPLLQEGDFYDGDGLVSGFADYDRNSLVTFATKPSPSTALQQTQFFYDGLGRMVKAMDADGNEVASDYDKNSNIVKSTRVDKHTSGRIASETFASYHVYDSLNRLVRSTDNMGQTRRFTYDSLSRVIRATDAQGPLMPDPFGLYLQGQINGDGNVNEVIHDGLGRTLKTIRELRQNGQGSNPLDLTNASNPDGKIIEASVWDDNSRLVSVSDDKSNTTNYHYDIRNRLVKTVFADGSTNQFKYDRDSHLVEFTDNNGSIVTNTLDILGRVVQKTIVRATHVKGTTVQTFEYDGLSRLARATDNNNPDDTADDSLITRGYDSLSRLLEDVQNGKVVSRNWTATGVPVDLTYPNNRKLGYTLDRLNRLTAITPAGQTTPLVSFDYLGSRLIERQYGNNTKLSLLDDTGTADAGYDALGRVAQLRHLGMGNTLIAGFRYGYDRENNKTFQENLTHPALSELYKYDSVYRLVSLERGTLDVTKTSIIGTSQVTTQSWILDGVGNWASTTTKELQQDCCATSTPFTKTYQQSVSEMNEYKYFGETQQFHDKNGNLLDDGKNLFTYDFANRLIEVRSRDRDELVGRYAYDVGNRRLSKFVKLVREYQADANTLGLWHLNEQNGLVYDSSGNGNHADPPNTLVQGVPGFFGYGAKFHATPIHIAPTPSLDSIQDKLTVEAYVCFGSGVNVKGGIVHRESSWRLEVQNADQRVAFRLFTKDGPTDKAEIVSDEPIPLGRWVHLAAVYTGQDIRLYVDGILQRDVKFISGNVKLDGSPLLIGGIAFKGCLDEVRVSNIVRKREWVERRFYYSGWQLIEEREKYGLEGEPLGSEILSRQFVDAAGIDAHVMQDVYDKSGTSIEKTLWYHEDARGDTVALTDALGNAVMRLSYSAYGEAYKVSDTGSLEPLSIVETEMVAFTFQGHYADAETSLIYMRNRMFNPRQGIFLQRDMLGYVDGMGLHEAFGGNPLQYFDPYGLDYESDKRLLQEYEQKVALLKDEKAKNELVETMFGQMTIAFHSREMFPPNALGLEHGEAVINQHAYSFVKDLDRPLGGSGVLDVGAMSIGKNSSIWVSPQMSAYQKYLIVKKAVELKELDEKYKASQYKPRELQYSAYFSCSDLALEILLAGFPELKEEMDKAREILLSELKAQEMLRQEGYYVPREPYPPAGVGISYQGYPFYTSARNVSNFLNQIGFKEISREEWKKKVGKE
jgi:RHS repeat-associated protein